MSRTPAQRKRVAIMKKGWNPTSAKRIARYVDPQTSQVAARQLTIIGESLRGG
jgi:hypothetical protein